MASDSDGIELACPKCKALLSVPTTAAGTEVPCPDCNEPIAVPDRTGIQEQPRWSSPRTSRYDDDDEPMPDIDARSAAAQMRVRELQDRVRKGANWFFWVAGLSVVNSVLIQSGASFYFVVGLGITTVTDVIAKEIGQQNNVASIVGIGFAVFVALIVAGFGVMAREGYRSFFVIGMVLYLLDGLLFLLVQDIVSMLFHAWALWGMWQGLSALRELRRIESEELG